METAIIVALITLIGTVIAAVAGIVTAIIQKRQAKSPAIEPDPVQPETRPETPAQAVERSEERALRLESSCGLDYRRLNGLLAARMWREANEETMSQILRASGRESFGPLDGSEASRGSLGDRDIEYLPAADLNTIDRLWTEHSNGRFGFSIQSRIWFEEPDWDRFCWRVGWVSPILQYEQHAPLGHLPTAPPHFAAGRAWNEAKVLARFRECNQVTSLIQI